MFSFRHIESETAVYSLILSNLVPRVNN